VPILDAMTNAPTPTGGTDRAGRRDRVLRRVRRTTAWTAVSATALTDLIIALVVTSLLRARVGLRTWRAVHWAAYLAWPLAVIHGLGVGTDSTTGWVLGVTLGCVAIAAAALVWRGTRGTEPAPLTARGRP
jgi:DMSO/TMAO reductase YedYZ heme-binding membrane subunit